MKLIGFVCALALVGAVGCGDSSDGNGDTGGTGGSTGGTGGTGNTGGTIEPDQCLNATDTAVYEEATYTNAGGDDFVGTDAVAEVAADCVFGSTTLVSDGCGPEVAAALANNTEANRAALATCVEVCTAEQGFDLTQGCLDCYGESVTCGAAFCAGPCASNVNAPACIECRCGENSGMANCFGDFDVCSGLPREPDDCAAL